MPWALQHQLLSERETVKLIEKLASSTVSDEANVYDDTDAAAASSFPAGKLIAP
jgi:hypothetical protein